MPAFKFKGVDFIEFDSLLTDDERLVRDTARRFIEENLIPIIEQCNRDGRFPRELVKPMADLGFFGASLKGYGCAGMGNVEYGLVMQELERGDSGVRSFVSVQSALCMYPIYAYGSDAQKDKWLPAIWMIVNAKNGVSSYEIHRALGITQKSAWFMLHRIRLAMQSGSLEKKLCGHVEADETFVGGKVENMHLDKQVRRVLQGRGGRGPSGKTIVMGLLERHGKARVKVLPARRKARVKVFWQITRTAVVNTRIAREPSWVLTASR